MKRRKFIQSTSLLSVPLLINKFPVFASSTLEDPSLNAMAVAAAQSDKIMVIIEMDGGVDGLYAIYPRNQWSAMDVSRGNILIPENAVLPLEGNAENGLHPQMTEIQQLYNEGKMMIVQGVSVPYTNYSHFRSADIVHSGSDGNQVIPTGWLARALNTIYDGYPTGYPNADMTDPIAISIGVGSALSLEGSNGTVGFNTRNPQDLSNIVNNSVDPAPNSDYGTELTFLRNVRTQSNAYIDVVRNAYNVPMPNNVSYNGFDSSSLSAQLRIVARLINGGLKTPVYIVKHEKNFDDHTDLADPNNPAQGRHANGLASLSRAIGLFQSDLQLIGKEDRVTSMTYTEFGRRVRSNGGSGTDHGTANNMMIFGSQLNTGAANVAGTAHPISGMIGTTPYIDPNPAVDFYLAMQFDYRQIYTSFLQDWLNMSSDQASAVLGGSFEKLPIFKNSSPTIKTFENKNSFFSVYPNPVTSNQINIRLNEAVYSKVNLSIYNLQGSKVYEELVMVNGTSMSLTLKNTFDSGNYIIELMFDDKRYHSKIIFSN